MMLMMLINNKFSLNATQMYFVTPRTKIMEALIQLHNDIMPLLIIITFFVLYIIAFLVYSTKNTVSWSMWEGFWNKYRLNHSRGLAWKTTHNTVLEIAWTIIPASILIIISIPSFALIYAMDELNDPVITVKVIGRQWYWSYELMRPYTHYTSVHHQLEVFDSYMVLEPDLSYGQKRLLTVDRVLTLPASTNIRILVTSFDVIHSWAIPAAAIKIDACPGRLNQISLNIPDVCVLSGQCSEICGLGHGAMPICISIIPFSTWVK